MHRPFSCMCLSGLFFETGAAAAAGDGDPALASWHPELLAAVGALEVAVLLVLPAALVDVVLADDGADSLQKFVVLGPAAGEVPGEHTQQSQNQADQPQQTQQTAPDEGREEVADQVNTHQGKAQLIGPVAPVHQSLEKVHPTTAPFPGTYYLSYPFLAKRSRKET